MILGDDGWRNDIFIKYKFGTAAWDYLKHLLKVFFITEVSVNIIYSKKFLKENHAL